MADRPPPTVVPRTSRRAKLPTFVRLPMLILLNILLQNVLWAGAENVLEHELGAVSRIPRPAGTEDSFADMAEPLVRLGTKVAMVALAWELRYDYIDIGALTAVINIPFTFLLTTFYNISLPTAFANVAIEVVAVALPTYLLRPVADINNPAVPLRNRFLLNSFQVSWSNTLLAVFAYATVLWVAITTDQLILFLITYSDLPSVEHAHNVQFLTFIPKMLIAGYATKTFLLNPSIASRGAATTTPPRAFDPATANLVQTLQHNFWFFSARTKTLIQRTAVLSVFLLANTMLRGATLEGLEYTGSAGYAGVWVLAAHVCAAWFVWTGDA